MKEFDMHCSTRWIVLALSLTAASLGCGSATTESTDALSLVSDRHLDLEVRQVAAGNLLRLLGDATNTAISVDACVATRRVDARFKNAPARLILSALGEQLGLVYRREGAVLKVGCRS